MNFNLDTSQNRAVESILALEKARLEVEMLHLAVANLTNIRAEIKNEMYLLKQKTLTAAVERQQQEFSQDIDLYNRHIDEARRKLADLAIFIITMI